MATKGSLVQSRAAGFTLIELLVVIAIIGLLSSVVLASLNGARIKARSARAIADMRQLQVALELYYSTNNTYPISSGWSGLYSCWGYQGADWIPGLAPTYIAALPRSPNISTDCDKNYIYYSNGVDYKLIWHQPEDCMGVVGPYPSMRDPTRYCWAYGFYTSGGSAW